jgi:hypothetical protein
LVQKRDHFRKELRRILKIGVDDDCSIACAKSSGDRGLVPKVAAGKTLICGSLMQPASLPGCSIEAAIIDKNNFVAWPVHSLPRIAARTANLDLVIDRNHYREQHVRA